MTLRLPAVTLFVLLLANGCSSVRRELIETRTATHVYRVPAALMVEGLATLTPERQWRLAKEGPNLLLLSPWRRDADLAELASSDSTYFAVIHRVNANLCTLKITRKTQTSNNEDAPLSTYVYDGQTVGTWHGQNVGGANASPNESHARRTAIERDLVLEWKVLQKLEPMAARDISAEVDSRLRAPRGQ